ncbi:TerD family protein [Virgisporangium ochraceum]|uniref:TerD domain-containing protein n=1 Tax=Virgisporangium ochraceum TaxID=65505 RepID=A0A8J4EA69_9ACTN|nr:TerD family protein [Virgisporangium ochraceum]GIJ67093.1 hypothetical protein Voc01_020100 [Virgisporangium ochraceum]
MSQRFVKGQKSRLSALTAATDLYVGVHLDGAGVEWDISCFGLDAGGRLSDDRYFVFFNQPESPEGALRKLGPRPGDTDSFRVLLDKVPTSIARLSFCAATGSAGTAAGIRAGHVRLVVDGEEVVRYAFAGGEFGAERAVIVADLYRKDGWRFGAVGQGFAGGLADLIRSFGGTVDQEADEDSPAPAAPEPPAAPPGRPAPHPPPAAPPPAAPPSAPPPGPGARQRAPVAGTPPGALAALSAFQQVDKPGQRWVRQNPYLVRVTLGPDCHARRGSMVAYQGDVKFEYKGSGGLRALFEGAMTGQQLRLMTCRGQGDVYLAENAADVHLLHLTGQRLCLNASNVLAFDAGLDTEIKRIESPAIPGGGMFHLEVGGQGTVVVMTRGTPVTLPVRGPTYADMNALVAWTAGMRVTASTQLRISREMYAGGPAEGIALQFMALGDHFIVVQPYEV